MSFSTIQLCDSRKIGYLTREFRVKLHLKSHSSLRDSCDIGFRVQFNAEFPRQVMNFRIKLTQFTSHCNEAETAWYTLSIFTRIPKLNLRHFKNISKIGDETFVAFANDLDIFSSIKALTRK